MLLLAAGCGAKLVAFPELAFTPFFPSTRCGGPPPLALAETVPGPTTDAFARAAADLLGLEKFPPALSLSVTFAILAGGVLYSLWKTRGDAINPTPSP